MILLKLFVYLILLQVIRIFVATWRESAKEVAEEQKAYNTRLQTNVEKERREAKKKSVSKNELYKQLAAVQYQLKLLEKLDYFCPGELRTEAEVKKALALEKQYNALWVKERKIKKALEELDS